MTKKILIATGGTGGHVIPAYSLANYLMRNNYDINITIDNRGLKFLKKYKKALTDLLAYATLVKPRGRVAQLVEQ